MTHLVNFRPSVVCCWQIKEDPHMVKDNYEEYIVEFSVTIVDPTYSKLLSDPEYLDYSAMKQELTEKVRCHWPTEGDL